jgi:Sulfotransferase family
MIWKVVRPPLRATFRMVSELYLVLSRREYRYIFILGHMRSGSTLLAHILASHPDIAGAGEMHVSYRTPTDLPTLVLKTSEFLRRPILRETYIVDQINHAYVTDDILLSDQVYRCIILIREPEATLKSMLNLSIQENAALEVYVNRLETLTQYGLLLRERALLVEYDDLIDHTEETLAALTGFLGLNSPLTPDYATHRMTARVAGYGDRSSNIKRGRIVRTPNHEVTLSKGTLIAAVPVFRKCREQLQAVTAQTVKRTAHPNKTDSTLVLDE